MWQCQHCERREGDPVAKRVHEKQDTGTFFGTRILDDVERLGRLETANGLWYSLCRQFSKRDISFPEDRLPTFSGIAKHFAGIFDRLLATGVSDSDIFRRAVYAAGLFSHDFSHGLCWRTLHPSSRIPYRAPSWSWASISSSVTHNLLAFGSKSPMLFEVLRVDCVVPGLNLYGKVTRGKLVLIGLVAPIPSHVYGDESEIVGGWRWRDPLLTPDINEEWAIGCVVLRVTEGCCLLLVPVKIAKRQGHGEVRIYRRAGMLSTPTDLEDPEKVKLKILDGLEWREEVLMIV